MTKKDLQHHYVEQRLIYYIHAHGSISERDLCHIRYKSLYNKTHWKLE